MASKFNKRHYEAIAEALSCYERSYPIAKFSIVNRLAAMFERDNARFKRDIWEEACKHPDDKN